MMIRPWVNLSFAMKQEICQAADTTNFADPSVPAVAFKTIESHISYMCDTGV
jgi:hypothetical protein